MNSKDAFNHEAAQAYEAKSGNYWIDQNIDKVIADRKAFASKVENVPWLYQLFMNDERRRALREHTVGREVLEIGPGPVPEVTMWTWARKAYIIDPLAAEYDRHTREKHGTSFFEGAEIFSSNAEAFISRLEGKIDGAIYSRNCLDHCPDPYIILANISAYAAPGCFLAMWTDLYHLEGHDEGHTNITQDVDGFGRVVRQLGFDVLFEGKLYADRPTIQYSCVAVKKS